MRYVLLIGGEDTGEVESSADICHAEDAMAWAEEMTRRGVLIEGAVLRPADEATTVRVREDSVLLTDGPFAETKEQIGGVCVIEADDLDDAIRIAARHPVAGFGMIEVRPLWLG
ncbi:YciI family protein [Amycolatopsis suaedae]|uniref:Transcription initiation protein n=1 Tax=Amycolatopsis suaedae TaxID=2510978 RepID=A0A4Q7JFN0_9PSEU|nr:YciI family protein [Amycolatopsis suaedae]RZQ66032.1 transcription initiation protein [Amycolatopsis suaedae]